MPNKSNTKKATDFETLVANRTNISNTLVKSAIEEHQKQQDEEKKRNIIRNIERIQNNTNNSYDYLKAVRLKEKAAKTHLEEVAAAENQYYADADYTKYQAAVDAANRKFNSVDMPYDRW